MGLKLKWFLKNEWHLPPLPLDVGIMREKFDKDEWHLTTTTIGHLVIWEKFDKDEWHLATSTIGHLVIWERNLLRMNDITMEPCVFISSFVKAATYHFVEKSAHVQSSVCLLINNTLSNIPTMTWRKNNFWLDQSNKGLVLLPVLLGYDHMQSTTLPS